MKLDNVWLQRKFDDFNEAYFYGRISKEYKVVFGNTKKEDNNGTCDTNARVITLDQDLQKIGCQRHIMTDLLHEMVHAYLGDDYIGHEKDRFHGMRFKAELWRLIMIGAFDGLL